METHIVQLLSNEQKNAIKRIEECPGNSFIAWWRMGTGKTRLALLAFALSDYTDLIVITRRVAFSSWRDEMEICNLDFLVYEDDYQPSSIRRLAVAKKRVLLFSAGNLKSFPENYPKGQFIVVDELYLFANHASKRSKLLQGITLFCSARLGLSGTIMPAKDNMTIFGQTKALQMHRVLADNATKFRATYQTRLKKQWGVSYLNLPGSDEVIASKLAPYVSLNFPEARPTVRQILSSTKTPQQQKFITELQEFYELGEQTYDYAIQIVNAVNGISNGWIVDADDRVSHLHVPKLGQLLALLEELVVCGERVVVWCAYHNDIARIAVELKLPWLEFTARTKFDVKAWTDKKANIVLATEANGASVNYFGDVKYAIYYSINYKVLDLEQSMMRHERKNSKHSGCHYYFLQTRGTYDARIYNLVNKSGLTEKDLVMTLIKEKCVNDA